MVGGDVSNFFLGGGAVQFGTLHRKFRYVRAAYFGLLKVSAQSHLKAMCLNLLKAANRLSVPVAA